MSDLMTHKGTKRGWREGVRVRGEGSKNYRLLAFGAGEFTNTSLHQPKQKELYASAEMTMIEIYK